MSCFDEKYNLMFDEPFQKNLICLVAAVHAQYEYDGLQEEIETKSRDINTQGYATYAGVISAKCEFLC